jgi:hypothetical protein
MYIGLFIVSADIRHREIATPYPPKNFEEVKVKGWKSGYLSVESVLRHLQREAMGYWAASYSSVELYVAILAQFCRFSGKNPDQQVALPKGELEDLVHSYLDHWCRMPAGCALRATST